MDLIDLYEQYREDPRFEHFRALGMNLVPGRGSVSPKVMLIGEAPGAQENLAKKPFVGKAGQLLTRLMALAGLYADDVPPSDDGQGPSMSVGRPANAFITNAVKYRPDTKNRTPTYEEAVAGRDYLRREWKILGRPPVIVVLGNVAANAVYTSRVSISALAGKYELLDSGVALWSQYHPMVGIYNQSMRPLMEKHWEAMGEWLRKEGHI